MTRSDKIQYSIASIVCQLTMLFVLNVMEFNANVLLSSPVVRLIVLGLFVWQVIGIVLFLKWKLASEAKTKYFQLVGFVVLFFIPLQFFLFAGYELCFPYWSEILNPR